MFKFCYIETIMSLFLTRRIWGILLSLAIIFSFALYLIELHHDHPHTVYGSGIQAVFHGEDIKWNFVLEALSANFFTQKETTLILLNLVVVFLSVMVIVSAVIVVLFVVMRRKTLQTLHELTSH